MNKKTLVLGASMNPTRYSNMAINQLVSHGIDVVAFGLRKGTISGVEIDTQLTPYNDIDTVTLYVGPKNQEDYFDYVLDLKPKRVIFNPGTQNPQFYKLLSQNNIAYEDACTLVLLSTKQY